MSAAHKYIDLDDTPAGADELHDQTTHVEITMDGITQEEKDMAYERVKLLRDTHFACGKLKAQAGATGSVVGNDQGMLTIYFDSTAHFVELDGSGLRIAHNVPCLAVDTLQ